MKKEEEKPATVEVEYFNKNEQYAKIQASMERQRNAAMERSVLVKVKPPQDPLEKLKRRIATYHNVRKMRTDYKNYTRKYGPVPSEISREFFHLN